MTTRMKHTDFFSSIRNVAMKLKPENGKIILFGSQARGDAHENSDWDILVLLDKDKIEVIDHDKFTYPFWELGWEINAMIHPIVYTSKEWSTLSHTPFRDNVELYGIVLF